MKRIKNLPQLKAAVEQKRSVVCPNSRSYGRPMPAAWAFNLCGSVLLTLFASGMFVYVKKPRVYKLNPRKDLEGATVTTSWDYELTNIEELFRVRPDLVKPAGLLEQLAGEALQTRILKRFNASQKKEGAK